MKFLTFKQLIAMLAEITPYDVNAFCGHVEDSFNHDKITSKEREILYKLLNKITKH